MSGAAPIEITILLHPSLLGGRTHLGDKIKAMCSASPSVREQRFDDEYTLKCPRINISVGAAGPDQASAARGGLLKSVTWRLQGGGTPGLPNVPHVLLCFTPHEFASAADRDGLGSLLTAAGELYPGWRVHLLTYEADRGCARQCALRVGAAGADEEEGHRSLAAALPGMPGSAGAGAEAAAQAMQERLWQLVADLAVWRPDVSFYNAGSLQDAAEHVRRLTRAVAELEGGYKKTTASSYLSVLPLTAAAQKKRDGLERLLAQYAVPRDGSAYALMRMQLAVEGVSPEAAYAVGAQYGSLQRLLQALEGNAAATMEAIAALPLPAEHRMVGRAAAEKLVAVLGPLA